MLGGTSSYAICWSRPGEPPATGKVTPTETMLELSGSVGSRAVSESISYLEIASVRIERTGPLRLRGQPTVVLERRGGELLLVAPLGPGILHEISSLIGELAARHHDDEIAVVLPLKESAIAAAKRHIAAGPPFDPVERGLDHHIVFLATTEAILVFGGVGAAETVRDIILDPAAWADANDWTPLLAGPPRLALATYVWSTATDARLSAAGRR
jgi:hypothetical protein